MNSIYFTSYVSNVYVKKNISFFTNTYKDIPYLADCILYKASYQSTLYFIINYLNLPANRTYIRHSHYTLYNENSNISYINIMNYSDISPNKYPITYNSFQILKYSMPIVKPFPSLSQIFLIDNKYNLSYHVTVKEQVDINTKREGIAICAYVSRYNSYYEVRSWVLYYKMIGIKQIILYSTSFIPFKSDFRDEIKSGFLKWVNVLWPVNNYYEKEQRSVQHIQINSCFYRYRNNFEYIINVDVDEYLLSTRFPINMYDTLNKLFSKYKSHTITVRILYKSITNRYHHTCINQWKLLTERAYLKMVVFSKHITAD